MNLRSKLLAQAKKPGSRVRDITIELDDEIVEAYVARPPLTARDKAMSLVNSDTGEIKNYSKLQAMAIVNCLYDCDDGTRVFDDADVDVLAGMACGDWFDEVSPDCVNLILPAQDKEGNSEG